MVNSQHIRTQYLEFFKERGHAVIPSAPIVPDNDPTTLFTGSGMQPIISYLLGKEHPAGSRITDSQKSFRAEDIEEVGDNRHTTFFEMLGNWSFGDYFKKEQLPWFFSFLVDVVGLDPKQIYVTVFSGDKDLGLPRDTESVLIWKQLFSEKGITAKDVELDTEEAGGKLGMQGGKIFYFGAKKNWWSRAGVPAKMPAGEPGGPDSEVFFDFYPELGDKCLVEGYGDFCHPNCDCGRFMEIGNSVFMEYKKNEDGTFAKLPRSNVDFGGGLERITAAAMNNADVFRIDSLGAIISGIEAATGSVYTGKNDSTTRAFRVVADHLRASVFILCDGVLPSNTEQGYILRRLLRRAIRFSDSLKVGEGALAGFANTIIDIYKDAYPLLHEKREHITTEILDEERRFRETLARGMKEFDRIEKDVIDGHTAFTLFTSYGFPIEITEELAKERNKTVDMDGFRTEMKKHQDLSRAGSEQKFKGGLADTSEMSVKYHTATHLLHQALRTVLGPTALQKGSNITPERLRFDFAHHTKMTDDEKHRVEEIVNAEIAKNLPVTYEDIPFDEAKKKGALGLFEEKYGDKVRVYQIGKGEDRFSLEFCGGPHVTETGVLGHFSIVKEEAVSQGVRRIKAVLR